MEFTKIGYDVTRKERKRGMKENREKKFVNSAIVIETIVMICCLMFVVVNWGDSSSYIGKQSNGQESEDTSTHSLEESSVEWDDSGMQKGEDSSQGIKIPGYGKIYFPSSEKQVEMTLYNPKENTCYFVFELYIDDEEIPIYASEYIEPGKALTAISLKRELTQGTYNMQIKISTYDTATEAPLNGAVLKTILEVI